MRKPGDVVVLDNGGAHKSVSTYSPDLNPMELCWNKLKSLLQHAEAPTREDLDKAIAEAMTAITPQDALNWFRYCGYWAQRN